MSLDNSLDCESLSTILNESTHILISGATGTGKTVLMQDLIYYIITHEDSAKLVLIDPLSISLSIFKGLPNTHAFVSDPYDIKDILKSMVLTINIRLKKMQDQKVKEYHGSTIYIFIDELYDLTTKYKEYILPPLKEIAFLGSTCNVRLICSTSIPTYESLPTSVFQYFSGRVAFHFTSYIESYKLIKVKGAENLDSPGKCIFSNKFGTLYHFTIPLIPRDEIQRVITNCASKCVGISSATKTQEKMKKIKKKRKRFTLLDLLRGNTLVFVNKDK